MIHSHCARQFLYMLAHSLNGAIIFSILQETGLDLLSLYVCQVIALGCDPGLYGFIV